MEQKSKEIRHHLSDDVLMAYSAGALPEAFNLVVASHVSLSDESRARLEAFDAVGGAVLDGSDTVALHADSLDATMALIAAQDGVREAPRAAPEDAVFPQPLRDYIDGDLDAVAWRSIGGGVRQSIIPTSSDATVRLLHIPAGTAIPDHGHSGMEMTLVLKGAFRDEFDRFARGDVEVANEHLNHTPIAEEGEDCICLAATDAPLKFSGFLPRIAQRFAGI
ncbi:MAG: ChrR family anti-sigma-E factor [Pseudomonadota bacterium]